MPHIPGYRSIRVKGTLEHLKSKGYKYLSIGDVIGVESVEQGGRPLREIVPAFVEEKRRWERCDFYRLESPEVVVLFHERDNVFFVREEYLTD